MRRALPFVTLNASKETARSVPVVTIGPRVPRVASGSMEIFAKILNWDITDYTIMNITGRRIDSNTLTKDTIDLIKYKNRYDLQLYNYAEKIFNDNLKKFYDY